MGKPAGASGERRGIGRRAFLAGAAAAVALPARAAGAPDAAFASIDGGTLRLRDWAGHPVLVVNTASQCAFTPQYDALQAVYDRYKSRGVVVLAVPSDDFNQELASEAAVKDFCEINFNLTLPMTEITHVRGSRAHPFYRWLALTHGFVPAWNFNKVLIGPDGALVATWGSRTRPDSAQVTRKIEALLDG